MLRWQFLRCRPGEEEAPAIEKPAEHTTYQLPKDGKATDPRQMLEALSGKKR